MAIHNKQIKESIVEDFKNGSFNLTILSKKYNTYNSDVTRILKSYGLSAKDKHHLQIRKYSLNEHYFDVIDTEDKAYFLGLLYADGSNNVKNTNISIRLQEDDKHILEDFIKYIGSDRPLLYTNYPSPGINRKPQYNIIFNSKILSKRLMDIGVVQNKEFVITFPDENILPVKLQRHFIRGYYDGDGSFSVYQISRNGKTQPRYEASIVSTDMFVSKMQEIIKDKFDMNSHISTRHKERNNSTRTLKICGKQMFRFLEWMYEDSTVFLKRKHEKYLNEISKLPEWPILKKVNQHH